MAGNVLQLVTTSVSLLQQCAVVAAWQVCHAVHYLGIIIIIKRLTLL